MRVKIESARSVNSGFETEISCAEQAVCTQTENQQQDMMTNRDIKKESEAITYDRMIQTDDVNDDNKYCLPIMLKSANKVEKLEDKTLQICEAKSIHDEGTHVPMENEAYKEDEVRFAAEKTAMYKTKKTASHKKNRRSNRLSNDKKENLKKTSTPGKVVKQKATKKSSRAAQNAKSDDMLTLYKKYEAERYKSLIPPIACASNSMPDKNVLHYGITSQEQVRQYSLNNNRNVLQYLDYDNPKYANQQVNPVNPNPWLIAPRSDHRYITLNNITNMQNNMRQSGFVPLVNWQSNENPYSYSSINPMDPYKPLPMENKGYCLCSICTNYMRNNNMYTGIENLSRRNATFQQVTRDTSSYASPTATFSNFMNTAVSPFNSFYNYQPLQADYNFKKLFYKTFGTVNYANNSGCQMMSLQENAMSPLNNWHQVNVLTTSCNSNGNIPLSASITSGASPSYSFYADSTNTHFSNQNRDTMKANIDQYSERDNFNPYTSTFAESLPASDMYGLDSVGLTSTLSQNVLSQNTTTSVDSGIIPDFLPETNTAVVSEEIQSCVDAKKKDWLTDVFDTL